jgi:hypothetical protein
MTKKKTPDKAAEYVAGWLDLFFRAGLTMDDITMDPEYGFLVTMEGARKMARLAPDPEAALAKIAQIEENADLHIAKTRGLH